MQARPPPHPTGRAAAAPRARCRRARLPALYSGGVLAGCRGAPAGSWAAPRNASVAGPLFAHAPTHAAAVGAAALAAFTTAAARAAVPTGLAAPAAAGPSPSPVVAVAPPTGPAVAASSPAASSPAASSPAWVSAFAAAAARQPTLLPAPAPASAFAIPYRVATEALPSRVTCEAETVAWHRRRLSRFHPSATEACLVVG